jgi:hypothetical protein
MNTIHGHLKEKKWTKKASAPGTGYKMRMGG